VKHGRRHQRGNVEHINGGAGGMSKNKLIDWAASKTEENQPADIEKRHWRHRRGASAAMAGISIRHHQAAPASALSPAWHNQRNGVTHQIRSVAWHQNNQLVHRHRLRGEILWRLLFWQHKATNEKASAT